MENTFWCHKPLDNDFEGIYGDCDDYMDCDECSYFNDYEEDD